LLAGNKKEDVGSKIRAQKLVSFIQQNGMQKKIKEY